MLREGRGEREGVDIRKRVGRSNGRGRDRMGIREEVHEEVGGGKGRRGGRMRQKVLCPHGGVAESRRSTVISIHTCLDGMCLLCALYLMIPGFIRLAVVSTSKGSWQRETARVKLRFFERG